MNRRSSWRRAVVKALVGGLAGLLAPASAGAMTEAKLANGLRFLYEERPASGLVAAAVLVGAGAAHETAANNGAAHFLEHLLFSGTASRTQEQLEHDVELIGAYSNATTQRDHVAYLMVAGSEDLDRALSIQADMLFHSSLPPDRVEKERGIIREEIGKDASDASFEPEQVLAQLLAGSAEHALPVLGTPASIAALSRGQIQDYYQRYYVPGNMTLLVLGEFAPDRLLAMVERHFGGAPAGIAPADAAPDSAPAGIFLRPAAGDRRLLRLRLPAGPPDTAPLPALVLVEELLNGEAGGLARALRAEPRIEGSASAALEFGAGRSWLEITAECDSTAEVEAVAGRLLGALRGLANAIDPVEMAAARSRREVAAALAGDEIHYVAFTRADWIRHAPLATWSNEAAALAAVDERAVAAAAAGLLTGKEAVLAAVGPGLPVVSENRNPLVLTEVNASAVAGADTSLWARRRRADATRLEQIYLTDVAWKRVTTRQAPVERTFPNGLTAIVASAPESEVFAIQLCARGRTFCEASGKSGLADLLHRVLPFGAEGSSKEYLARQLDLAGIRLKLTDDPRIPYDDYQTNQMFSFIRLETVDHYGTNAIHQLSRLVQSPDLFADALAEVKRQAVLEAERRAASPADQSQMLLRQQLFGTSPGARPALGTVADLRGITAEDLRAFHQQYFAPSNLILAVATGIEPEAVLAYIGAAMGGTHTSAGTPGHPLGCSQPAAMRPEPTHTPSRREQLMAKDQSWIRLGTVLEPKPTDLPALEVAALVLSDRLMAELRERRGLAYSVGASLARAGDRAWLTAGMGTRPDSLAAAEAGLTAEIRGLGQSISADEVTRVVKTYQGRQRMRRLTRINQAQAMALDVLAGHPPGSSEPALMALARVRPADVERVARSYCVQAPLVTAIAR